MMKLRIDPVGQERVIFFNYGAGESPLESPPVLILIRPNETPMSHFFSGRFWENLGVSTLTTHLEANGVKFGVLEASLFQATRVRTIELAATYAPRVVGISVFSTDLLEESLQIAAGIKRLRSDIITVLGGHGASFVHEEILENNEFVDLVIRGEAERSLLMLLESPDSEHWSEIPNLSFRSEGRIFANAISPSERDLDNAPLPHRFVRDIANTDPVLAMSPLMLISSRGCFDRCAFCTITKFYSNTWRGRSPRHVVDELEFIVNRYSRRSVHFWDDTFIGPGARGRQRAIEIANEIQERELNITFHITTRPTDLREDVVAALAAAGMRSVFIGVESSDQGTLDYFGKHAKIDDATNAIDLLWRYGVHRILAGFILFHPKMTWDSFKKDLDYLGSFPYVEISRIVSRLTYYPGAQFWLENQHILGPDAYKRYLMPNLPEAGLEELYRICLSFHNHTISVESVLVCLEEQYLHDTTVIDFIAACRCSLFRFIAERVGIVASRLERGLNAVEEESQYRAEIYTESLHVLDALKRQIDDEYLDLLLKAHLIDNHEQFLRTPRATKKKPAAMREGRQRFGAAN